MRSVFSLSRDSALPIYVFVWVSGNSLEMLASVLYFCCWRGMCTVIIMKMVITTSLRFSSHSLLQEVNVSQVRHHKCWWHFCCRLPEWLPDWLVSLSVSPLSTLQHTRPLTVKVNAKKPLPGNGNGRGCCCPHCAALCPFHLLFLPVCVC